MLRLLVKLAVSALIANAVWRVGSEYLAYYRFKDDVRNAAEFRKGSGSDDDLRLKIEQLAADFDVPLDDADLKIDSDQADPVKRAVVALSYVKPIEVFPGYQYPWSFSFSIETAYTTRY